MTFILLSTLALLSFSGAATASSLRLAINPRTLYSFKNNYADSSCTQLVSATMDVFYASTSATVIGSCSPETTGSGQTVFYKEILSEVNQYESCATGIVFRWQLHRLHQILSIIIAYFSEKKYIDPFPSSLFDLADVRLIVSAFHEFWTSCVRKVK